MGSCVYLCLALRASVSLVLSFAISGTVRDRLPSHPVQSASSTPQSMGWAGGRWWFLASPFPSYTAVHQEGLLAIQAARLGAVCVALGTIAVFLVAAGPQCEMIVLRDEQGH